jgi:hypothetical protein
MNSGSQKRSETHRIHHHGRCLGERAFPMPMPLLEIENCNFVPGGPQLQLRLRHIYPGVVTSVWMKRFISRNGYEFGGHTSKGKGC